MVCCHLRSGTLPRDMFTLSVRCFLFCFLLSTYITQIYHIIQNAPPTLLQSPFNIGHKGTLFSLLDVTAHYVDTVESELPH